MVNVCFSFLSGFGCLGVCHAFSIRCSRVVDPRPKHSKNHKFAKNRRIDALLMT